MIAMNTPLQTQPLSTPPDARLSAADALSSLSSLTDSREAVARRFVTPLWYKIASFGCTVVMTMLIWALWGGLFASFTDLHILLGCAGVIVVGMAVEIALVVRMERRGVHWLTKPPTLKAWLYSVMMPIFCLAVVVAPIVHHGLPWWAALGVAVAGGGAILMLVNLSDAEVRDYIMAGGSMSEVQIDGGGRRSGKDGELWTRARLLALPDDERRETARRLTAPVWLHPAIGLMVMLCIVSVLETVATFMGGSSPTSFVITAMDFALIAAMATAVTRWTRDVKADTRMMPASTASWALFFAMVATCFIPVYLAGYGLGFILGHSPAQVPLVELAVGGAAYVVLFSIFGQLYDRRRYGEIAKGA